jgi:MerR family transcriptional regulator, light-induced transcriptional regulator
MPDSKCQRRSRDDRISRCLSAAAAAGDNGWQVTYLGPSLPTEEIVGAAIQGRARAVALSIVYPEDDFELVTELKKLRRLLSPEVPLITGGRAVPGYTAVLSEIGAIQLQDLSAFYRTLDNLRRPLRRTTR